MHVVMLLCAIRVAAGGSGDLRERTQLGPPLCDPMDYSPPGSSVSMGFFQARLLGAGSHFLLQGVTPLGSQKLSCVWAPWSGLRVKAL